MHDEWSVRDSDYSTPHQKNAILREKTRAAGEVPGMRKGYI